MGLRVSFGCFHGPYSQFMRWRVFIAKMVGIPLMAMEGFVTNYITTEEFSEIKEKLRSDIYSEPLYSGYCVMDAMKDCQGLPWNDSDPLTILLHHSDCDGRIRWFDAKKIALRLIPILREMKNDTNPSAPAMGCYDGMYPCTKRFIFGLIKAHKARKDIRFA